MFFAATHSCRRLLRIQPKPKKSSSVKGGHQHPVRVDQHQQPGSPQGDSGPVNAHIPVPATQQLVCHPARSFFTGAHDFNISKFELVDSSKTIQGNGYVDASQHITVNKYNRGESNGWDTLLQNTAPSALLDSQSYDAGRCDDDTRLDVLQDIDAWIQDTGSPQKLLCITGPVGCGKSALQRTTAERCSAKGTLAASFFFSSSDPARNDTVYFIPTLAYQFASDPGIRALIVQCIDADPLVFKKSLRSQMEAMVISPIRQAIVTAKLSGSGVYPLPNVVVVDGLDECKGESMQSELLKALEHLVRSLSAVGFPLRVIVTSRPEWTIWSAVEANGHISTLTRHLKLADEYDATEDIRRYAQRHLGEIASRTRDPRVRARGGWPAEEDVDALVDNASGQFIYVIVALNYIGERHSSPVDRLKTVLSWSPAEAASGKHPAHPLSPLDTLYAGILENAQEAYGEFEHGSGIESIVMLIRLHQFNKGARFTGQNRKGLSLDLPGFEAFLGMQDGETYGLISDMRSLLTIREKGHVLASQKDDGLQALPGGYDHIHFYHASLLDLLDDPNRAGELYVPSAEVACHFVVCALQQITGAFDHDIETLLTGENIPKGQKEGSSRLRVLDFSLQILGVALQEVALLTQPFIQALYKFTEAAGWEKLDTYVRAMGASGQYSSAFSGVLTLYAAKCFDEGVFEDYTKDQLAKLMDIVGDHRRSWMKG